MHCFKMDKMVNKTNYWKTQYIVINIADESATDRICSAQ